MKTRSEKTMSLQFGSWGRITDLDKKDFSLPENEPFLICNEGEDVFLDVNNADGMLVKDVLFRKGYDPKLVTVIKKTEFDVSLIWGN